MVALPLSSNLGGKIAADTVRGGSLAGHNGEAPACGFGFQRADQAIEHLRWWAIDRLEGDGGPEAVSPAGAGPGSVAMQPDVMQSRANRAGRRKYRSDPQTVVFATEFMPVVARTLPVRRFNPVLQDGPSDIVKMH